MESSRRDLFNNMAEHRFITKNNQNAYHPSFGFPKQVKLSPKRGFVFTVLCEDVKVIVFFFSWPIFCHNFSAETVTQRNNGLDALVLSKFNSMKSVNESMRSRKISSRCMDYTHDAKKRGLFRTRTCPDCLAGVTPRSTTDPEGLIVHLPGRPESALIRIVGDILYLLIG